MAMAAVREARKRRIVSYTFDDEDFTDDHSNAGSPRKVGSKTVSSILFFSLRLN